MFKIGNRVRNKGRLGTVTDIDTNTDGTQHLFVDYDNGDEGECNARFYEKVYKVYQDKETTNSPEQDRKANKTMLQPLAALSNLIQRTFKEDVKALYRAGYLSKDLNITNKLTTAVGEMFVGHIIDGTIAETTLATFATELVAKANEEIVEAEVEQKNK